jgi:predicted CXXCH cytochrome family protein
MEETGHTHGALEEGKCSGCHDPHGGETEKFLLAEGKDLCYSCHTDFGHREGEVQVHQPVTDGECLTCHMPHGSSFKWNLVEQVPGICLSCHDPTEEETKAAHRNLELGDAACTSCHDPHSSGKPGLIAANTHEPFEADACEVCHEAEPQGNILKLAGEQTDICSDCHGEILTGTHAHGAVGEHGCTGCHSPHSSSRDFLLTDNKKNICLECHPDHSGDATSVSLHPMIEEGECEKCHLPHSADNKQLLVASQPELCFECHASVRPEKNYSKHTPFAKGKCSECHNPHTSKDKNLLDKGVPELCLSCHGANVAQLRTVHGGYKVDRGDCAMCHDPHWTPAGTKSLLYPVVHEPLESGCDVCHTKDITEGISEIEDLCVGCHGEVVEDSDRYVHDALESKGMCTNCHNPHRGYGKELLRKVGDDICFSCHDEKSKKGRDVVHAPVVDGCLNCHSAHSSDERFLLSSGINELCESCHADELQMHGHILGEDAKDPRTGEDLTCASCHNSHSSDIPSLLRAEPKRELCMGCHYLDREFKR